jgi:hypothetical protein
MVNSAKMTEAPPPARKRWSTGRALLCGTLAVGVFDALGALLLKGAWGAGVALFMKILGPARVQEVFFRPPTT